MKYNILTSSSGKQYYKNKKYPPIPPSETDIYIVAVVGDRLDLISNSYYKDASLWWIIAMVNNVNSMFPEPGVQLRIPTDLSNVMKLLEKANK